MSVPLGFLFGFGLWLGTTVGSFALFKACAAVLIRHIQGFGFILSMYDPQVR